MSATLLIAPDRLRWALTWLSHRSGIGYVPLAAYGARVALGWGVPTWAGPAALALSVLLIVAGMLGGRLHDELDDAGLPCRWCDLRADDTDEIGGAA